MICSKAELLTFLNKAGSATDHELGLLALVQPLVERKLKDHLGQELEYATFTEYLPLSGGALDEVDLTDYDFRGGRVTPITRWGRSDKLQLRNTPVWNDATLTVYEDLNAYAGQASGAFAAATELTKGSDFYLDLEGESYTSGETTTEYSHSGLLVRCSGAWPYQARSVKVTYHGGWQAAQFDISGRAQQIKLAALHAIAYNFEQTKQLATNAGVGPLVSESIGKYSASYASQVAQSMGLRIALPSGVIENLEEFRNYGVLL